MEYNILVVEDEKNILDVIRAYLEKENYNVITAIDGEKGLELFRTEDIHLIILDLMIPKISGEEVCKEIRNTSDLPIIMLTAKADEENKIEGLNMGADDYVTKPFSPRELISRVKALLRRSYKGRNLPTEILSFNNELVIDKDKMTVNKDNLSISLTTIEFKILYALASNNSIVLSREKLIDIAFGNDYEGYDRTIDTHIKNLRQKIETDPKNPKYITTVYVKKYSITYFLKKILRGSFIGKINSHYCSDLNDNDVIQFCELRGLIIMFMRRIDKSSKLYYMLYNNLLKSFSEKVAKYAIKNNTKVVIMYDTLAYPTFKYIKNKNPKIKTVLDMSAPFLPYMYDIYSNDVSKNESESKLLKSEITSVGYLNLVKNSFNEIKYTDYYISASEFTNKSLIKFGINSSQIFLCRYGINKIFSEINYNYENKITNEQRINCVYTGNINQKKGMLTLAKVIDIVGTKDFNFH